ncbi:MAG: hypothetical protein ASARMPRED_002185 [Alectoria sarmentosa]|nr:MAG: hypothetical protein ASARMPRED_002185 [Alectoria sarmentosa]
MPPAAKYPLAVRQSPTFDTNAVPDETWIRDKTIVITGGASGFGEGFFRKWAADGATVVIGDINVQRGDQLVREVKKETGNSDLHSFYCDVTDWQSQVQFFKDAVNVSPHGGIDTVVANAGIVDAAPTIETPRGLDALDPPPPNLAVLDVNLKGVLYTSHLALFYLAKNPQSAPADPDCDPAKTFRDRHLLLMSSMAGIAPIPNQTLDTPLFTTTARALLAGGSMGNAEDVVDAATRFVADPRVVGRAVVVGPKLKVEQDSNGQWSLVDDQEKRGEEKAIWEVYAHDFEDTEIFTRRIVGILNRAMEMKGWSGWLKDMFAAFRNMSLFLQRLQHVELDEEKNSSDGMWGAIFLLPVQSAFLSHRPDYLTNPITYNATFTPHAAFQPPEPLSHRYSDTIDTFSSYKYRNTCHISSLDLHAPFAPLCPDRESMVTAMSSGGRIGNDAPYMPRGCDMRWFSTEEICEILARFEKVIIVGDSMMRHVIGSINVMIRKDLGYGAVTDWNFSPEERKDCFCNYQFNVKACSIQGIFKTADVVKNDPDSVACPAHSIDVMIEQMIRFPIAPEELDRLRSLLPATKPSRPYAFIFGHGLWNDLDLQATLDWLDTILDTMLSQAPWLSPSSSMSSSGSSISHKRERDKGFWPRLFLTPNAPGKDKPDEWIITQGNKAIMIFEESVGIEVRKRGLEHLGTWNATVQSNKFDGVYVFFSGAYVGITGRTLI